MRLFVATTVACLCGVVLAQTSPSYRLENGSLHTGAQTSVSTGLASESYRMRLQTVGQALTGQAIHGSTFAMDVGFVQGYPPPGEVVRLVALDRSTVTWHPERSVGAYRLYRGELGQLPAGYGECRLPELFDEHAQLDEEPAAGQGFFYLVTARNSLHEEGTKGYDSAGARRINPAPCP
jgi:hypothetical protein